MLDQIKNYFVNFDGLTDTCRTIALWITIALVVAFVTTKVFLIVLKKRSKKYGEETLVGANSIVNSAWIIVALVVAAIIIVTFFSCYLVEVSRGDDTLVPILFYPLIVLAAVAVGCAAALFFKPVKLTRIICACVAGCALIAAVVCMIVYSLGDEAGEALSDVGLYISAIALVAAIIVFAVFADRKSKPFDTRSITFAAVCVALSFALSYVRLFKMPMGGSITFASMLPLMLFAFMFGCRKGILVGLVYGVLQAIQDPWIIHPAQFALDYAVAFMAIGLTGCFKNLGLFKGNMRAQFALGAITACLLRLLSHYFAGVFAFGTYGEFYAAEYNMPALANPYLYSFVYQCMYLIPELAIVLAVSMIVFASSNFRKQIEKYSERAEKSGASVVHAQETGEATEPLEVSTETAARANIENEEAPNA